MTFETLYKKRLRRSLGRESDTGQREDAYHLDCLLHPEKYPPVLITEPCSECGNDLACQKSCIFDA